MAAPYAKWHIALLPRSTLFSAFLCSVTFLLQAFRSQSIGFAIAGALPPTLLCASAIHSGQLFSVRIVHRFTLSALHLHKCWITLCWCTKQPSKDKLPLPCPPAHGKRYSHLNIAHGSIASYMHRTVYLTMNKWTACVSLTSYYVGEVSV